MPRNETNGSVIPERPSAQRLARLTLFVFLLTFIVARVMVYLIMSRRMPDLYLYLGGTHVHHLNYGIILLSGVGATMIFFEPQRRALRACTTLYAIGLALTFDEFGMWLHLGGPYWQRASFDAVVVIAAALGLIASASTLRNFAPRHWIASSVVILGLGLFAIAWRDSLRNSQQRLRVRFENLEQRAPQ